jgi:hypothetical protein
LDDFPTPPWATRALFEHVLIPSLGLLGRRDLKGMQCWEPCANRGYMVSPLLEYFMSVTATDIHDYGVGYPQHDFLMPYMPGRMPHGSPDWIITNPPFRLAEQIISKGLTTSRIGVAVLVRSAFEEGIERFNKLFWKRPPTLMGVFAERVIMHKGMMRDPSKEYWDERTQSMKRPSTATSYKWMVWIEGMTPRPQIWIPPCRRKLEREGDYPG